MNILLKSEALGTVPGASRTKPFIRIIPINHLPCTTNGKIGSDKLKRELGSEEARRVENSRESQR